MAEPYKRLDEDNLTSTTIPDTTQDSSHGHLNMGQGQQQPMICVASPVNRQPIKAYAPRTMVISAMGQLGISIVVFLLTIVLIIIGASSYGRVMAPVDGTGIWNGILGIIAGSFGVAATLRMRQRGKCLMITYMGCCIIFNDK